MLSRPLARSLLSLINPHRIRPPSPGSPHLLRTLATMVTSPDWQRVEPTTKAATCPAYSVFTKPIEKSEQDDREYRILELDNGLQVTLVSDPKGDKAAASLDVAVGHLSDPNDMPGLAHFCEHLLFMGTEQFPRENEYSEYLAKNSGSSNAYTSVTNTNYYFNIGPPALKGALERFSGFFHSPLFSPSCTVRELNAVDSEHKKNHQSDIWRIFQVNKHNSRPGNPWSKFGTGNRETLERAAKEAKKQRLNAERKMAGVASVSVSAEPSRAPSPALAEGEDDGGEVGRETRRRLVDWWSKEYCASRMKLCVIGKDSLDQLAEMVVPLFSPIPNRGIDPLPMFNEHPFGSDEQGTLLSVQTIMDFHCMEVSWPLEWQPPHWKHSPSNFLSHFIGHEGPGSLFSYLKEKGWVTALSAGPQNLARGFAMSKVTVHLTKSGFDNHQAVTLAIYNYLALFRSSTFEPWQQSELALLARTRFRFQEKSRADNYATYISEHMSWPLPRDKLLSGPPVMWEWDKEGKAEADMRRMLEGMRMHKGRTLLMARPEEFERIWGKEVDWKTEPIYGTKFRVQKYEDEVVKLAEAPNKLNDLFLPGPNEFIPTNFDVDKKSVLEPSKRPYLIRETPLSTVWHKKDDQFWVPKTHAIIQLVSPLANKTARQWVMTRLWVDLVTDSLSEFAYDAELAGLAYNLSSHNRGTFITVSGYSDKLSLLARHVFERLRSLKVRTERLHDVREKTKREWENFFLGQSYTISNYSAGYLLADCQWTILEKLAELSGITPEDIDRHAEEFLSKVHLEMLFNGNIRKEHALEFANMTEKIINTSAIPSSDVPERALLLPEGSNHVWQLPVPNPNEPNSALTYFVHTGDANDAMLRVKTSLLTQLLSEPAFNILRTQEQLGYIVHCSQLVLARDCHTGIKIVVQSERAPAYLEERVEAFLDSMRTKIEDMPSEDFEAQKRGLARQWTERLKNLREETNRFWKYIEAGHLDFLRKINDATQLETVTKADILNLFTTKVHSSAPTRAKLSIHLRSQKKPVQKLSSAALAALQQRLGEAGVSAETLASAAEFNGDTEPTVPAAAKFLTELFSRLPNISKETTENIVKAIPELAEAHKPESAYEGTLKEEVVLITDPKAFKASLTVAPDPTPVVQWGDLPASKL